MNTQKRKILPILLSLFELTTACNHSSQPVNSARKISSADTSTSTITCKINAEKESFTQENYSFPVDSLFTSRVLTVGNFHSDEVWKNVDKEKWFGLFKNLTGFYIAETKLKTKRVFDPIFDANEQDNSGWDVQTTNKDTSIILIRAGKYLKPRKIEQALLSKEHVFPDESLQINYLGIKYNLYATGNKKEVPDNPGWFEVWNYKLYMTATINGQERTSLLAAQPNFNDQMIRLIFAGDIDGDGILDLIIDNSAHYNETSPTIYLSEPAKNGEIVKPIGGHTSVGC